MQNWVYILYIQRTERSGWDNIPGCSIENRGCLFVCMSVGERSVGEPSVGECCVGEPSVGEHCAGELVILYIDPPIIVLTMLSTPSETSLNCVLGILTLTFLSH